jgi:acetyl-CoA synthetase
MGYIQVPLPTFPLRCYRVLVGVELDMKYHPAESDASWSSVGASIRASPAPGSQPGKPCGFRVCSGDHRSRDNHMAASSESLDFVSAPIVWRPTDQHIKNSNLKRFMDRHRIGSYDELMRRSTDDVAWFWDDILWNEFKLRFDKPYERIVDFSRGIALPRWCVGGEMNIVTNLLDRYEGAETDRRFAIKYETEDGTPTTLTFAQLRAEVNRCANALRSLGIGKGDAVGVFMPLNPQCVIAMLAIIKVGGVFLPLFSGFGAGAIVSRLVDADAKAMFTCDSFSRRGKTVDMKSVADEAARDIPTLKHVIVYRRGDGSAAMKSGRDHWWNELVDRQPDRAPTERTSAEDVMMIIYTSGTTGRPKGAVHTHCGFPVKGAQDMLHGLDVHTDETVWWVTDIGWMMGPWLIFGTLLIGATMMLYDGALDHPGPDRLWDLCEKHKVTALGISPTLIRALLKHGEEPVNKHDLSSLRKFASTGEPWNPAPWMWLFEKVGKSKLPIINYSGGTEISGGILMGNVIMPLKPCAFSAPLPGMAVDVLDETGKPVRGKVGELVIKKPWIGMTRGFWKDEKRYLDTYWSRWSDTWVHGDFAMVDDAGLWYIVGRSDDTIKVAGKRLGPAEVESILVADPAVQEAAAVGIPDELKGQALVCFVVLKPGNDAARDQLQPRLVERIVKELGKPLAPKAILFVKDLPKTRNAKVLRRVIRAAYLGENPGDISSLENPAAVEEIKLATR